MTVADKLGFLPFAGWMAGHDFFVTLLLCWVVTPGAMMIIAPIFERRRLPMGYRRQFLSFHPGDMLLGVCVACLLEAAKRLPAEERWYNDARWHVVVLFIASAVAFAMTAVEWCSGTYPKRAILSPTKLYHNGILYIGYGYVAATALVAVVAGSTWTNEVLRLMAVAFVFGGLWVALVVIEPVVFGAERMKIKAMNAHVANWRPLWRRA